ncbi:MAG: FAD-dependent oxidoreductase [Candidatus Acidiferrales bacterium]
MERIAIIGGGPAGSLCGERLASAGFDVTLYDERLAWEKPCGGGLTHKAIARYPFLLHSPHPKKIVHSAELISSRGKRARFEMSRPIVVYARAVLNGLLLDRAVGAGCRAVHARVNRVETKAGHPRLSANGEEQETDFVVVAAGARNAIFPETTPLLPADLEMTLGYFVPIESDTIKVKFLDRFEGYLWSFPRADHLSVGICGKMTGNSSQRLRRHLDEFCREERIPLDAARFYSHVLPSPQAATIRHRRIIGDNWALVGDAAACVDPVTGEGLYYALRSGDLLAQSLAERIPQSYPARLRAEFSADLEFAARIAKRIFAGRFLGDAVTTRMIQFLHRSATFRDLIRDVFSGAQDYRTLKRRLWKQVGSTFAEILNSFFEPASSAGEHEATP